MGVGIQSRARATAAPLASAFHSSPENISFLARRTCSAAGSAAMNRDAPRPGCAERARPGTTTRQFIRTSRLAPREDRYPIDTHSSSGGGPYSSARNVSDSRARARRASGRPPVSRSAYMSTARANGIPFQLVSSTPFLNCLSCTSSGADSFDPTFVVSKLSAPELVQDRQFKKGVELTSWNGIPFARAVDMYADRETGGRPDARRARALESLSFRALEYGPPPDEMWVTIGYRSARGASREGRMNWRVVVPGLARSAQPGLGAPRFIAADPAAEQVRRAKKLMFSGELWKAEASGAAVARARDWIPTPMHDALAAREVEHR